MRPACFDRAEFTDPNAGWFDTGWRRQQQPKEADLPWKPVLRYRWPWFTDRCTVHDKADIGPGMTYAQHYGWDCSGCKWKPEGVA